MSNKIRQILRRIALCAVVAVSFGTAAVCAFASGRDDTSAGGGSADGWQTLTPVGDQSAIPSSALPQSAADIDTKGRESGKPASVNQTTVVVGAPIPSEGAAPTLNLVAGESLEMQLQNWAHRAGWTLTWQMQDDWVVPGNSSYGSNFEQAAIEVVEQAAKNGADIRWDSYEGNHTFVVHQAGAM